MPQTGQDTISTNRPVTQYPKNISEAGYKCVCLNARSIINKNTELNIMVEDIDPHIIGIIIVTYSAMLNHGLIKTYQMLN